MNAFCRDCLRPLPQEHASRCPSCGSPRLLRHAELDSLSLAHIDCDAFFAAVEKRDNPALQDKPLIIGGGKRGVVSTCCYLARMSGVRSAMPMFQARKLCPEAVVMRGNMEKYATVGRQIRVLFQEVTPLVEPLSLDEAFLDLAGTDLLHGHRPAMTLADLAKRIEKEIGIAVSIGLSYNKFLAKLASDLDKPRGFAVIGRAEAVEFLSPRPVSDIWGVGAALARKLAADGITRIGQLHHREENELVARYGVMGTRLYHFSRGQDQRKVTPDAPTKSISAETTFDEDITSFENLRATLWPLCEKVSSRLKRAGLAGRTVTLKLKTANFKTRTRSHALKDPTQMADTLFEEALPILEREAAGDRFRLIGIGASGLCDAAEADPPDLLDMNRVQRRQVEKAMDAVRERFGRGAIMKGRGLKKPGLKEADTKEADTKEADTKGRGLSSRGRPEGRGGTDRP